MGRRKGELTLLMEIASKWPWKVSAALVPLSYVVCHLIAAAVNPPASITGLSDTGSVVIRGYIHTFTAFLQYIFPMIFLVTAVVSFVRRSRSITLFDDVRGGSKADIANLSWQEFEALVGEGFRHRGFQVTPRGGAAPDGGVDDVRRHRNGPRGARAGNTNHRGSVLDGVSVLRAVAPALNRRSQIARESGAAASGIVRSCRISQLMSVSARA
jgi:hypothetical protein